MITSVIPLPNFHVPGSTIYGYSESYTNGDNPYGIDMTLSLGRNLTITDRMWKYKLQLVINDSTSGAVNQPFYIVMLSNDEIDTRTMCYKGRVRAGYQYILPIYAHGMGRTYMFVDAVNELLRRYPSSPTPGVISPLQFVDHVFLQIGGEIGICSPGVNKSLDVADVCFNEPLLQVVSQVCANDSVADYDTFSRRYALTASSMPMEIDMIRRFRRLTDLRMFVNPYVRNINEVCDAATFSSSAWESTRQYLETHDALLTASTDSRLPPTPEESSRMGSFLSALYAYDSDDFWFTPDFGIRDVGDKYFKNIDTLHGFTSNTQLVRQYTADGITLGLIQATDIFGRFVGRRLIAHRSCMEDVSVYDKDDNTLLLYIDLPMWLLASCNGLINRNNIDAW